jgi:hypothetical protein
MSQCLDCLQELHKQFTSDDQVSQLEWRLARACHNLADLLKLEDKKKHAKQIRSLAYNGKMHADASLVTSPEDYRSHYWIGITLQDVADFEGTKFLLTNLPYIRERFERAHELNTAEAMPLYCLGAYCWGLADMSWVTRNLAAAIFATPPTASYEEAYDYYKRAEKAQPGFWAKNLLQLGKSAKKIGKPKEEQRQWLEAALEVARKDVEPDDSECKKEAEELLKAL